VAHIAADVDGVVTANSAGRRLSGLGGAEDGAAGLDDAVALPHHGNYGPGSHVGKESREEGLFDKVLVVLLEQLLVCLHHLESHELEAFLLKTPGIYTASSSVHRPPSRVSADTSLHVACMRFDATFCLLRLDISSSVEKGVIAFSRRSQGMGEGRGRGAEEHGGERVERT
jgi:hypothetical protein